MRNWFKLLFACNKKELIEDLDVIYGFLHEYKKSINIASEMKLEIEVLMQVIANQEDDLKVIPEAIRSGRELKAKLEALQHKYDSKVNMYRKRISQLEGKNE